VVGENQGRWDGRRLQQVLRNLVTNAIKYGAAGAPVRVALTGEAGGPELDLAVPAIDRGAELPAAAGLAPIVGCQDRAAAFAQLTAES